MNEAGKEAEESKNIERSMMSNNPSSEVSAEKDRPVRSKWCLVTVILFGWAYLMCLITVLIPQVQFS